MNLPDFTDSEFQLVNQILLERYNRLVSLQAVEVELLLDPEDKEPSACPALYWSELGAEFIVAKVADQRFTCQFFYSESEVFGTGHESYDNLGDCVTNLLQLQADHHGTRSAAMSETLGDKAPDLDEDYHGPLII
ncbi:MAG: hypothetical protein Q8M11_01845 [Sulfuritalea sp.]|jgi:hypothetical protein|nr:hypothetical protein [Sulfuritalea sp.]MDP1983009.1 hypothetical protein [Sulfuritalea sp.]